MEASKGRVKEGSGDEECKEVEIGRWREMEMGPFEEIEMGRWKHLKVG